MPLESSKARLKSSQHGYRDLCVTTFLKRSSNNVALASDTFLAFDDQAFNLRQCLAVHLCPQSYGFTPVHPRFELEPIPEGQHDASSVVVQALGSERNAEGI
jgi:hypothetical protein